MTKEILSEYADVREEVKDLRRRSAKLESELLRMVDEKHLVTDFVSKGRKGKKSLGRVCIQGFPVPMYRNKAKELDHLKNKLDSHESELMSLLNDVETYIESINDSRIRRIFRYRYIDDLNWVQVAGRIGGKHTADSCRVAHDRFLEK